MRGTASAVIGVCAVILTGCATASSHGQQSTPTRPSPTAVTSKVLVLEPVVDPRPDPLHVGVVSIGTDDGGEVSTAMWSRPTFAAGGKGFPRSIELALDIDNQQGPPLFIRASYKVHGHPANRVPRGGCTGIAHIPSTIARATEKQGCLGYLIPSEAGRLILSAKINFHYYLPVRAKR